MQPGSARRGPPAGSGGRGVSLSLMAPSAPGMRGGLRRRILVAVIVAFALAAPQASAAAPSARTPCPSRGQAKPEGPSARAETLREAGPDGPKVQGVSYPLPDGDAELWSQWGQGLVAADGRYFSAVGDHRGRDGNSYLYVLDPATEELTRFTDVLSHVDHERGGTGYGKVHAQLVPSRCNHILLSTYWGSSDEVEFTDTYRGDVLFDLDARTLELRALGVPVPEHGVPSLAGARGLVFGEAVDPTRWIVPDKPLNGKVGAFFAYDVAKGEVVFRADDARMYGFRNILVDRQGRAYVADTSGGLLVYERGADSLQPFDGKLPGGGWLRASTRPDRDGTVYGVTDSPQEFFALEADGTVRDLGAARGYTASLAVDPAGDRFYYVPGAHGDAPAQGTPLIAVDGETGQQEIVTKLNELAEQKLGLALAGTYNLATDRAGERLYVGFNAGKDTGDPWGEVVLFIVHLT
jgi:hypothetical protein